MSEYMIPIPSRVYNAAVGGHVAGADQIIDDKTGLTLDKVAGGALEEKEYISSSNNGMGRVVLRKNIVKGVNTLTQNMINKSNTIYVIQYDFTLGENITISENCVLEFDGGSISNGVLSGNNLKIIGNDTHLQDIYLDINNGDYCVINNIYFDYTFATRNSINITNTNNILIKDVNITLDTEPLNQGEYIEAEAIRLTSCENINISKCRFINTKSHYIDSTHGIIYGDGCHYIKIKDCYSTGGKNEGFNFNNSTDILFDNIFVENMSGSAIVTGESCKNLTITNTTVKNTGASNLSINSTENVLISNCIIENDNTQNSGTNSITLGHPGLVSKNIVVSDCIITTTNAKGIGGVSVGNVFIKNCIIKSINPIVLYTEENNDTNEIIIEGCKLFAYNESSFNITSSSGIITIINCILENCFYETAANGMIFNYIGNDVSGIKTHPIIEFIVRDSDIANCKEAVIRDNYIHDCSYTTTQQHISGGMAGVNCIFGSICSSQQTVIKNNHIIISIDNIDVSLIAMRAYVGNYIIEGNTIISDITSLIFVTTDEGGHYKYCIVNNNVIISSKISIRYMINDRIYNSVDYVFANSNYINNKVYYSNMLIGDRPKTEFMTPGAFYFDTTTNKLEIYTGNNWVDATGTSV